MMLAAKRSRVDRSGVPIGVGTVAARKGRMLPGTRQAAALRICGALLLLLAVACAGCSTTTKTEQLKIGVLDPLSGPYAAVGVDARNGAELAADIVNGVYPDLSLPMSDRPGLPNLGGAKLILDYADTQGDPEIGASEAERLVTEQGVVALTGAYQSGVTRTASERAERLKIPFVNGDSSSAPLTARGLGYFFRTGPTDLTFGQTFFSLIEDRKAAGVPIATVAILHINNQYGNDGATVTEQLAREHGLALVADVSYYPESNDLVPYVQQVQAKKPDALFVLSYTPDALLLQKALTQLGYRPPAVLGYGAGFSAPQFVASPEASAAAQGFLRRSAWSAQLAERNPTPQKVTQMFEAKFGAPMTEVSARTFTAMMTLAMAINNARSTDPEKIRSSLRNIDVPSKDLIVAPWDYVRFDASGQNTGARGVVEQFLDGKWSVVYPNDLRTQQVRWPIPA